jgi:hypothetical protein
MNIYVYKYMIVYAKAVPVPSLGLGFFEPPMPRAIAARLRSRAQEFIGHVRLCLPGDCHWIGFKGTQETTDLPVPSPVTFKAMEAITMLLIGKHR